MTRFTGSLAAALVALALAVPASASQLEVPAPSTPYGLETNPLGTVKWLPGNANETPAGGANRLIVVHDYSLNEAGQQVPLLAKGTFGVKFIPLGPDPRMVAHSPKITSLDDVTGRSEIGPVDQAFMGVAGDVRQSACSLAGTPAFSAAYTTTRTFFHPGTAPYVPVTAPGTCEVVDSSTAVTNQAGETTGFTTRVTNHVPGFWIDVTWASRSVPGAGNGYLGPELYYGSAYDTGGENGAWYATADSTGQSVSTGPPGDYTQWFTFTANPGAIGAPCPGTPGVTPAPAGTWQDHKITVPSNATQVVFRLFPHGDWDLQVEDPDGLVGTSGNFGVSEQETVPASGTGNIGTLTPGEFTMRGCNYAGEQVVKGAVIIRTA